MHIYLLTTTFAKTLKHSIINMWVVSCVLEKSTIMIIDFEKYVDLPDMA